MTPLITDGRAPGPGEVALGVLTMEEEDLRIGDELSIVDPIAGSRDFRITGTVVLNVAGVDVSIPPGRGALFDWSVLELLDPEQAEFIAPQIFLVDAEPGRTRGGGGAADRAVPDLHPARRRSSRSTSSTWATPPCSRARWVSSSASWASARSPTPC